MSERFAVEEGLSHQHPSVHTPVECVRSHLRTTTTLVTPPTCRFRSLIWHSFVTKGSVLVPCSNLRVAARVLWEVIRVTRELERTKCTRGLVNKYRGDRIVRMMAEILCMSVLLV